MSRERCIFADVQQLTTKIFTDGGAFGMSCQIALFNRARQQLGVIRFNSDTREITFDWNRNYPQEIADAVTSLLQKAHAEKGVKARRDILIEGEDGKNIYVQKNETVSIDEPNFFAALTDTLNRADDLKSKVFAVLQKA